MGGQAAAHSGHIGAAGQELLGAQGGPAGVGVDGVGILWERGRWSRGHQVSPGPGRAGPAAYLPGVLKPPVDQLKLLS